MVQNFPRKVLLAQRKNKISGNRFWDAERCECDVMVSDVYFGFLADFKSEQFISER